MLPELQFQGAWVIVTGAGAGIGRATALVFAELGASLILIGRREEPLHETQRLLAPFGVASACFSCDVTDEQAVTVLRTRVETQTASLKALINNVGGSPPRTEIDALPAEAWEAGLAANASSTLFMTKQFLPLLERSPNAAIVNVASIAGGISGFARSSAYAAGKGAVIALTRQLAIDLAPRGIRINAISPGATDSPRASSEAMRAAREAMIARTPLGRYATPREIANTIAFMASDAALFLHGANVIVDGGRSLT